MSSPSIKGSNRQPTLSRNALDSRKTLNTDILEGSVIKNYQTLKETSFRVP